MPPLDSKGVGFEPPQHPPPPPRTPLIVQQIDWPAFNRSLTLDCGLTFDKDLSYIKELIGYIYEVPHHVNKELKLLDVNLFYPNRLGLYNTKIIYFHFPI